MKKRRQVARDKIRSVMQTAVEENSLPKMNLRPAVLDDLGVLCALSWLSRETEKACPGTCVEYSCSIQEKEVPENLKTVVFRLVQGAVANAISHGKSSRIRIALGKANRWLQLTVEDNGQGFGSFKMGGISCSRDWAASYAA